MYNDPNDGSRAKNQRPPVNTFVPYTPTAQNIEKEILDYATSVQVVLEGLTEIPTTSAPVMAFKLVVTLDLKRHENDAKVEFSRSAAYEGLLAEYGARFSEYGAKIQWALTMHTTFPIESIHDKFEEQKTALQEMRNELRELFIRLDTPREKEIRDTIDSCGGPKTCINDNKVLQILFDKSGEGIAVLGGRPDTNLSQTRQSTNM
ncbi:hypothetical protein C0995_015587 [Termitomyces sp. Mi166|nr:hypothetical protein C0995_015587 [Termitomyces sp. Mi166\